MKVALDTLGCPKNTADSELIKVALKVNHIALAQTDTADTVIVNTCAFIKDAVNESLEKIFQYVSSGKRVIVTGCLLGRYKEQIINELQEVQDWIDFEEQIYIAQYLKKNALVPEHPELLRAGLKKHLPYAYVKIADGCSRACAFCAIPLIKGRLHSRSYTSIISEIRGLAESGIKEIILVAQDVTAYGQDKGAQLKVLLKKIVKIPLDFALRLLYLYPADLDRELIDIMIHEKKIMNYFDIPVQHSSEQILKKMQRYYNKKKLLNIIDYIRQNDEKAVLRTTLLTGFPGETEKDVENLKSFMKDVEFNHLGVFAYSHEEGTPAFVWKDSVHYKTKQKRVNELMLLQQSISAQKLSVFQNAVVEAVIDKRHDDVYYEARNHYFAPEIDGLIFAESRTKLHSGQSVKIKITKTAEYDLYGEVL